MTEYNTLARGEGESFEAYRTRRALANEAVKALKRGVLVHDSYVYGTYTNPQKRAEKEARKISKAIRKHNNQ
jgi:hypothetical protein